ncbi:hypothetical protein [Pseudarthrobacter sp. NamB4]|uniref:hypothetical protein n=1 Tax=Pseudarthrobacter sp. NamB4 TaxID=2576837 RepID=UPI00148530E7|nr:hypothetical protein [Pseudarthrobacter sp. NamB4]
MSPAASLGTDYGAGITKISGNFRNELSVESRAGTVKGAAGNDGFVSERGWRQD